MALVLRRALFETFQPFQQAKRFRGKINIQRPKAPHYERSKYIELSRPWFLSTKRDKTALDLCEKNNTRNKKNIDNPFQRIVAGELSRWFHESKLIAFYHMNPMNADLQYKAHVMFYREKMHFKNYGKKTLEMAIKDTKFEAVLDFYASQNMTVFSPEPELKKLLRITKKFPQLVLLCAIFEGKLLSKDEIMELSLIPNLEAARSNLVHTLNSAASHLHTQLNTHQNTLVSQLQERIKQLEEEK